MDFEILPALKLDVAPSRLVEDLFPSADTQPVLSTLQSQSVDTLTRIFPGDRDMCVSCIA